MELWIRSQDKTELVKVEGIKYETVPVGHSILVPYEFGVFNVGQYKSKERALEVLDEIQIIVKWCQTNMKYVTIGDCDKLIGSFNDYVYEMPQE